MVSSNYDQVIGQCVFDIIKAIGVNGLVTIEPGGRETLIRIQNGTNL